METQELLLKKKHAIDSQIKRIYDGKEKGNLVELQELQTELHLKLSQFQPPSSSNNN